MKLTEMHLAVICMVAVVMVLVGLWAIHWGLPVIAIGAFVFIVAIETDGCDKKGP